jgi:hypothetical protein
MKSGREGVDEATTRAVASFMFCFVFKSFSGGILREKA